jgi:hypothetical protein
VNTEIHSAKRKGNTLMAWRYHSDDNRVEVIVESDFRGDLVALASSRPVWIVDTPLNRPRIDAVWAVGADMNLCEVSRYDGRGTENRTENLLEILGCLDDHHHHHDIVVHGIEPTELDTVLQDEGFRITEATLDGFVAVQIPEVRDRLLGRA